jgi:ABC-type glycerol-3-phosphate transport system permease component
MENTIKPSSDLSSPVFVTRTVPWYRNRKVTQLITNIILYIIILIGGSILILPFLWMVTSGLKDLKHIFLFPPQIIPNPAHWENFYDGWTKYANFTLYLRNTLIIVTNNVIGNLVSCVLAAYGFSRLKARGKEFWFLLVLGTMMIPMWVTLVPQYVLFSKLHWTNSFLPLTIPAWFGWPFFIFLLRQFFMTIPKDLDDAARIDGCNTWQILWNVLLPLSGPALATVAVFAFIGNWNNFLAPLIYLRDTDLYTLAIGLQRFQGTHGNVQYHYMMAVSSLVVLPIIAIFFLAQRLFVQGVVMTGIKG